MFRKLYISIFTLICFTPHFIFGQNWDTSNAQMTVLKGHTAQVQCAVFSLDGTVLAAADEDKVIRVWDIKKENCISVLKGTLGNIYCLALSPDKQYLASGEDSGEIKIWDISKGKCIHQLQKHRKVVNSICFTSDGTMLASGSQDLNVFVWKVLDGSCLKSLNHWSGTWSSIYNVQFSPDSQKLAVAMIDRVVVWDLNTEKRITLGGWLNPLGDKLDPVITTKISPDGQYLLAGSVISEDIKLWNLANRRCIQSFETTHPLCDLKWFPDGKRFIQSSTYHITVWDITDPLKSQKIHSPDRILATNCDGKNLLCAVHHYDYDDKTELIGIIRMNENKNIKE